MTPLWKEERFYLATPHGPSLTDAYSYTYKGLGLHLAMQGAGTGKRARKPIWTLTHINTGLSVGYYHGSLSTAAEMGTEVAELLDWSFMGPDGWKNVEPEIKAKLQSVIKKYSGGKLPSVEHDPDFVRAGARAVMDKRESA